MYTDLTQLTHEHFEKLGFTKEVWYDKNHSKDPFNTLKFIKYERPVLENQIVVEVTFAFISDDGANYNQIEAVSELKIGSEYLPINENLVNEFTEFLKLMTVAQITIEETSKIN